MSARLIAQLVVSLGTVVGRAFFAAYKQAAANAAAGGGAARGATKEGAVDALTRKTGMSMEEACQILNVTQEAELEKILKNYEHLFNVNETAKGGSFYIQSKVVRAKERIEMERKEAEKQAAKEQEPSPNASSENNNNASPPPS
ncbi:Pam16-domain-containing protein [Phascolomyces articulosus]|uniref:Mitochondrial import inner membrane translocase subunit TIM16 n=1 Tax=Phascolomyces articulosus TaxID=60185 RepID=A0AAD5PEE2_9FUNG|nr:Pam16-domain-containing protein [Phascolomyces articulosus]